MAASPVQEIKEKLDIAEFLKGYLTLNQAGKNFKALCPFHREKTPSFMVSPDRQSWHCFGCAAGGDVFSFVMKYENVEFGEALRILAEKAGVELRRVSPQEYKQFGLLYEINDVAAKLFVQALAINEEAKNYLASRGLTQETISEFSLGYAPEGRDGLTVELVKKGYDSNDVIRAGLTIRSERGTLFDRFRGRLMFPIHNHAGKVVGFTGRILPRLDGEGIGKYVNSPETAIFVKSKLLYGFNASKSHIRERKNAFLVEGQMDFLMGWQAGVKHIVATSGTALTADHLKTLRRWCDSLVFRFDSDEAGYAALERAIDLAEAEDFGVRVATDEKYKDPAEAAQNDPSYFIETVEKSIPAPEFYFKRYLPQGSAVSSAAQFQNRDYLSRLRVVLSKIKFISSPVERATWIKELSARVGMAEQTLNQEMASLEVSQKEPANQPSVASAQKEQTRWELVSERVLTYALAKENYALVKQCRTMLAPRYQKVADALSLGEKKSEEKEADDILHYITLASAMLPDEDEETLRKHLEKEYNSERRQALTSVIRQAEVSKNAALLQKTLEELSKLPSQ